MNLEKPNRLQTDWPFKANKLPFFYGWAIAVLSTLGFLMSIPGQTMGMAVFADVFIERSGLSRTELSTAYLLGTLGSAFLLTRAGQWYDRLGARTMIVAASVLLAIMLLFLSFAPDAGRAFAQELGVAALYTSGPLMVIGYFGVRFAGQGVLTSASRNVLLVWFEKRRGLVSGVRGVFVSLGFSIAPLLIALLIDAAGWQGALLWMAGGVGIVFAALALLTIRDHPRVSGLEPDGADLSNADEAQTRTGVKNFTLAQARRSAVFWIYSLALSMHALFGTAVTFHVVAIFEAASRSRSEAFAYFIPQAVVSLLTNLTASALADHMRLKPLLIFMLCAFIAGAMGLINLESTSGYYLLIAGFGMGGGLWGVLSNLVFVRQFGTLHLGAISGLNTSLTVTASAIGPAFFSLALDNYGTFNAAAYGCMAGLIVLLIVAIAIRQPLDRKP